MYDSTMFPASSKRSTAISAGHVEGTAVVVSGTSRPYKDADY